MIRHSKLSILQTFFVQTLPEALEEVLLSAFLLCWSGQGPKAKHRHQYYREFEKWPWNRNATQSLTGCTCRRGAWPGEYGWGLVGLTEAEIPDGGEGGLRLRKDHRAEDEEVREEGYRDGEEEKEDLEEYLAEDGERGEEAALPLEKFERRAHTSSSIRLTSPLEGRGVTHWRYRRCKTTGTVKSDFRFSVTLCASVQENAMKDLYTPNAFLCVCKLSAALSSQMSHKHLCKCLDIRKYPPRMSHGAVSTLPWGGEAPPLCPLYFIRWSVMSKPFHKFVFPLCPLQICAAAGVNIWRRIFASFIRSASVV